MKYLPLIIVGGLAGIVWLYIVARVVTRGVLRTLDERKLHEQEKQEQKKKSGS